MLKHFEAKYGTQRISKESLAQIEKDIDGLKGIIEKTEEEHHALWWLKVLKCRGEAVYATYRKR